jgi:hypothetical protein
MTQTMEKSLSAELRLKPTEASSNVHLGVSSPRPVWDAGKFRPGEEQIVFRRWRLGLFVFYGAAALLIGGLALVDRPRTLISAEAPANPAMASASDIRRPH